MSPYPLPKNEKRRLQALYDYDILDTISEKEYDSITRIASEICDVPVSLITLLDEQRQWFKSSFGFEVKETPREFAFCNYTIMDKDNIMVVPDLRADERFSENPLVTGHPNAVFYAGAPLVTPDGFVLGSICVLDGKINNLTDSQKDALKALSEQVIGTLELRKKIKELKLVQQKLKKVNKNLKDFAHIVSHDMKTPLANISMLTGAFENSGGRFNADDQQILELINKSAKCLSVFVDRILTQVVSNKDNTTVKTVDSYSVISEVIDLIAPPADFEISVQKELPKLRMDKGCLQQVFQNLITNAIKYNNKKKGIISITARTDQSFHHFQVADNGSGISRNDIAKIFQQRQTLDKTDRYGNKGTGIGLHTVKKILKDLGGKIVVTSEKNKGSVFAISIPCMTA
ncbi:MAG: GAF domain-containing sensor histidine kinase [Flavitalea sp.]